MAEYRRKQRAIRLPKREVPKEQFQELWEQRLLEAEEAKREWEEEYMVPELKKAWEGHQKPDFWPHDQWFSINLILSAFRILQRSVVPRELEVQVRLTKSYRANPQIVQQFQAQGDLRRAVLQYYAEHLEVADEARLCYANAHWAFGTLKVGYSAEMEDNPNAGSPMFTSGGELVMDPMSGEVMTEPDHQVVKEQFFLDFVDSECILVDKDCGNDPRKTGRWIAHKIFRPVDEVKRDPLYSNTQNLEPSFLEDREKEYLSRSEYRTPVVGWNNAAMELPENQLVVLYEVYDLIRKEVFTIARGAREVVRKAQPIPKGVDGHPFIFLKMIERPGKFYPIPLIHHMLGAQMEYNLRRNMMALHLKRYGRKYGYRGIEPEELEKMEASWDGVYIQMGANGAIEPIKDAPLDQAHYFDTSQLHKEFDELSGVGQLQRSRIGAESATEAQIVENRAQQGETDEHEMVMKFLGQAFKKLHKCVEANLTQEGAVMVTGPAGQAWAYFGPENFEPIDGEFVFEVRTEESQRQTLMVERSQLIQFISVIMGNPMLMMAEGTMRALIDTFPVIARNELIIQELKMLAQFMIQMQMGGLGGGQAKAGGPPQGDGKPGEGKGAPPGKGPPTSQGQVEKEARPVVSR